MGVIPVWTPDEALGHLDHLADRADLHFLATAGAVLVDIGPEHPLPARLADVLRRAPVVVIGIGDPEPGSPGPPSVDIAVARGLDDDATAPRPWIAGGEQRARALAAAAAGAPGPAVVLAQLLRAGEALTADDALVAESVAYGLLQAGPAHRAWLARRPTVAPPSPRDETRVAVARDDDGVLRLTLTAPATRNAYDAALRDELVAALQIALVDDGVTAVVIDADGPAFCSGGHLGEFGTVADPVAAHLLRSTTGAAGLLAALATRIPVRAHVHGAAVGAGIELAAFATTVRATADATFALPELGMGVVPGAGGTVSIPRRIGRQRTLAWAVEGSPLPAARAHAWGLVDEVGDGAAIHRD